MIKNWAQNKNKPTKKETKENKNNPTKTENKNIYSRLELLIMTAPVRIKPMLRIVCWNLPIIQKRISTELKNTDTKPNHTTKTQTK